MTGNEKKSWTVYGLAIAALFWLAWLAFCGVMVATSGKAADAVWSIFCFSSFLVWNYLLAVAIKKNSGWMGLGLALVPVVLAAWPVTLISRVSPNFFCRMQMCQTGMLQAQPEDERLTGFNTPEEERRFMQCGMRRGREVPGMQTCHMVVTLPLEDAAERFRVVSHVLVPEPPVAYECTYAQWKENMDATIFRTPFGLPYYQDYTVWVWCTGLGENYPLSAAGFAACVDGAADADSLYAAIKTTSQAERAAYERYDAACWHSRLGTGGATYFFLLLIMIRMIRRKTYQPQA